MGTAATTQAGEARPLEPTLGRRLRLWAEFLALFVGAPLVMAFWLSPQMIYTMLLGVGALGVVLLGLTPGWRWRRLIDGPLLSEWRLILVFTVGAAAVVSAATLALVPERFLSLPLYRPDIMQRLALMYPIVLVIPQEILFRPLFFERYGALFPTRLTAHVVNAGVFALAHLFYWNWPAVVFSTLGSIFFAYAYEARRSFPLAWLLHSIGGLLVFALGLGIYFFHGAVGR